MKEELNCFSKKLIKIPFDVKEGIHADITQKK